jgi:hypothetical protein
MNPNAIVKTNCMQKQILTITLILFLFSCNKSGSSDLAAFASTGIGGSLARFTIAGNYLYTVDKQDLKVYDISNGSQPQYKGATSVGFEIETIYPFQDKLFIGSTSVVYIFSISDPAKPAKLAIATAQNIFRRCDPVVAKDTVAYATLRTNGPCGGIQSMLVAYDIKNISNPVQKATLPVSEPYGLGYSDNALYVCDRNQGLIVFDITQAYSPAYVKNVPIMNGDPVDVVPYNNVLICWTTKGMILFDISNKLNPVLIKGIY